MKKTYRVEQATYNLKWHKDKEMLRKYRLDWVDSLITMIRAKPVVFHTFIYKNDNLVALHTRKSFHEAEALGKKVCSYK
jgi:hypothetical protein